MIKSRNFWIGALSLAVIPILIIDIGQHTVDWTKDVHNEIINLAYHQEIFSADEKKSLVESIFDQNQTLGLQLVLKSILCVLLLGGAIYFIRRYRKERKENILKPSLFIIATVFFFLSIKVFVMPRMIFNSDIHVLSYKPEKETFESFYNKNFKGKVVYVDFWGVYCGPCLEEFKHFTPKIKQHYSSKKDVEFLYICGGDEIRHSYMWREQIKKYKVEGKHIFLNIKEYVKLYNMLAAENNEYVTMPRYMIIDGKGNVTVKDAARPSEKSKLLAQINKSLIATNK
jgi:thiol-disulfide isomerase/thioredoxin